MLNRRPQPRRAGAAAGPKSAPDGDARPVTPPGVTRLDIWLMIVVTVACFALTVSPVLRSAGVYIVPVVAVLAVISPYSALILFSASQVLADPPGLPVTIAQAAFLAFGASTIFKRYTYWKPLRLFARAAGPYLVWLVVIDALHGEPTNVPLILAFVICAAGCILLARPGMRTDIALLGICIGSATACMSWWGPVLHLNVFGMENLSREGMQRLVVGRLGGISGFPAALATVGFLGLVLWQRERPLGMFPRLALLGMSVVVALSIPGTMGRGALLALVVGVAILLAHGFFMAGTNPRKQQGVFLLLAVCVLGAYMATRSERINKYLQATIDFTEDQATSFRTTRERLIYGYRSAHMLQMAFLILKYPLDGVPPDVTFDSPWGMGTKEEILGNVPHNVFLGQGMAYGLPGMALFTFFFIAPVIRLLRRLREPESGVLLACHGVFFILFMFFPFGNYKIFYLLWAIESHVVLRLMPAADPKRRVPL